MDWHISYRADKHALPLADEHYNRQAVGSPQFVPPGRCLVLLTDDRQALWTTSFPYAEYTKHAWAGAWVCSLFRRREASPYVASDLITQAIAATRWAFGDPPELGMITFVDPSIVPGYFRRTPKGNVLEWGYSYIKAGFQQAGWTKGGLVALQMKPDVIPDAVAPKGAQLKMAI